MKYSSISYKFYWVKKNLYWARTSKDIYLKASYYKKAYELYVSLEPHVNNLNPSSKNEIFIKKFKQTKGIILKYIAEYRSFMPKD